MSENLYRVTEDEKRIMEVRTREVSEKVCQGTSAVDELCGYACENGFTEDEAVRLIKEEVIPVVDEYNASCREAMVGDIHEWLSNKIFQINEGMNLNEECKCKLSLLRAIRSADMNILNHIGETDCAGWEEEYESLCSSEEEQLESGEYTSEMLDSINHALEAAIENCGIPLSMSVHFEEFLDGKMDDESVKDFTYEIWEDEKYKYCAATAACVARHNAELPSIPSETPDRIIVLGICQGIDVDNMEKQVAIGEMAADTAYKILKVIAAVGLTLVAIGLVYYTIVATAVLSMSVVTGIFGSGIVGGLVAFALILGVGNEIADAVISMTGTVSRALSKAADFTYGKLKQGAKVVHHYTVDKVIPCIKESLHNIKDFICNMVNCVHTYMKNKQTISC